MLPLNLDDIYIKLKRIITNIYIYIFAQTIFFLLYKLRFYKPRVRWKLFAASIRRVKARFFFFVFVLVVNVVVFVIVFEKKVLVSKTEMLKGKILVDNNIKILCDQVSRFSNNLTKLMEWNEKRSNQSFVVKKVE